MPKSVLFVFPYPQDESPSQRFRFEQYLSLLPANGIRYRLEPFFTSHDWRAVYTPGHTGKKIALFLNGSFRRLRMLFILPAYDYVFIHREAFPAGPPILEWLITKVFRKKVIFDFDDAIWTTDKRSESMLERIIKWRSKTGSICSWSHRISAGNAYLCDYARQFNDRVTLNPTTIDTTHDYNPPPRQQQTAASSITIGWTGSYSTLKYFRPMIPILQKIMRDHPNVNILVVADKADGSFPEGFHFEPWRKETEIINLLKMEVGLMPLPDDPWAQGKCGLKSLQYMALGIPSVISPVGVNREIIQDNVNGFLCDTDEHWLQALRKLVEDAGLRQRIGQAGKQTVIDRYSVSANASVFLSLFQV